MAHVFKVEFNDIELNDDDARTIETAIQEAAADAVQSIQIPAKRDVKLSRELEQVKIRGIVFNRS